MAELRLSKIGFGCWQFGSKGDSDYWGLEFTQELADTLVQTAVQNGITYFDTAEDYGAGASETMLGKSVKSLNDQQRQNVVIGSKLLPNHCAENDVERYVDDTLKRLGIDCIDLYMVHWPISKEGMSHFKGGSTKSGGRDYSSSGAVDDSEVPSTEGAFRALMKMQKAGKIRHIGVSNFGVTQLQEALATGVTIAVNQLCYNLIFRAVEFEILPFCREQGIQVLAYSPLMQGLLTGKWTKLEEVPVYRARTRHFDCSKNPKIRHGEGGCEEMLFTTLAKLQQVSDRCGISMIDLALSWPLHQDGVSCVIAGATKEAQVINNGKGANRVLPADVVKDLNAATEELKQVLGGNADLWQGADSRIR